MMVLADTSVWVAHLRDGHPVLQSLLQDVSVLCHPFVIGELACGNLANRSEILDLLQQLPRAVVAHDDEVLAFIERHGCMGRGIGLVDVHLLTAAALSGAQFWTLDRRLRQVASELGTAYN